MLPPEILDQVTSLNKWHRDLISMIHQLSRSSEITSQLILDDLTAQIKVGFAEADREIEVSSFLSPFEATEVRRLLKP